MGFGRRTFTSVMKSDCHLPGKKRVRPQHCLQLGLSPLCSAPPPPLQVVCGSKYLVRGESARDHVDLLVSSRHWPPVYVVDMATPVALCADLCYPELTDQMWGRNQGCFSSPMEPPMVSFLLRNCGLTTFHPLVLRKGLLGTITSIFFLHQQFVFRLWNQHLLHTFLVTNPCVCVRPQHVT